MRRGGLIGLAAGAFLVLAASVSAYAYWQATAVIPADSVTTGDLDLRVTWDGGTDWGSIGPGETVSKHATIDVTMVGDNLSAQLHASATENQAFTPHIARAINLDDCSGTPGPAFPAGGYPDSGSLIPGASVSVCVRYTLAGDAPASDLKGEDLSPAVTFDLVQG